MTSKRARRNTHPDDDDQRNFFGELCARTSPDVRNFVSRYQRSLRKAPIYVVQKPQYGRPHPPQHPWLVARETLACIYDDERAYRCPEWRAPLFSPITCQLANGHTLVIHAGYRLEWRVENLIGGITPTEVFSIRIYSTEDSLPKRLHLCEEFRAGFDFHVASILEIWSWLLSLTQSRAIFVYDTLEGFLTDVTDFFARNNIEEPDAFDHLETLAWLSAPKWFDRTDDSIFNDQTG